MLRMSPWLALPALAALVVAAAAFAPKSTAADVRMIAQVGAVQMAADGKSARVTVKNVKGGDAIVVTVTDAATLEKLAARSIGPGDQVRLMFDDNGGHNLSKTFKKAEGC